MTTSRLKSLRLSDDYLRGGHCGSKKFPFRVKIFDMLLYGDFRCITLSLFHCLFFKRSRMNDRMKENTHMRYSAVVGNIKSLTVWYWDLISNVWMIFNEILLCDAFSRLFKYFV